MLPMLYDRQRSSLCIATVTCCYLLLLSYAEVDDILLPQAADALSLTISTPVEYSYHTEDTAASDHTGKVRQSSSSSNNENERSTVSQTITSTTRGIHSSRRRLIQHASLFILDFLADNNNSTRTDEGDFSDYMTISNPTSDTVSLQGWSVTDIKMSDRDWWPFPAYNLPPKSDIVVFASKRDCSPAGISGRAECAEFHTDFALGKKEGGYLALKGPDGTLATEITYPKQYPDISYGYRRDLAMAAGKPVGLLSYLDTDDEASNISDHGLLSNSSIIINQTNHFGIGLEALRPRISRVTENISPMPQKSQAFPIFAKVDVIPPNEHIAEVRLHYLVGFEEKSNSLPMLDDGVFPDSQAGDNVYTALLNAAWIPGLTFEPGTMVRWYVAATDTSRRSTRAPKLQTSDGPNYFGTAIVDPATSGETALPVMLWFIKDAAAAERDVPTPAAVLFRDRFYDNVFVRRRGSDRGTEDTVGRKPKDWPKHKFKFDFKGAVFHYEEGQLPVEEFNLQSHYQEPGHETYMRENIAAHFLHAAGVAVSKVFHIQLRQNGLFYGLYSFVEQIDETFLERNNLASGYGSSLYKAVHWKYSNLRPPDGELACPWAAPDWKHAWKAPAEGWPYCPETYRKTLGDFMDWSDLWAFTEGINVEGDVERGRFVMDHVNLPQVINEIAAEAVMLHQDRCTKNYYVFHSRKTDEWMMLPWDNEDAFATDGVGLCSEADCADNVTKYCILSCEKFNSPLFCDRDHPQDLHQNTTYNHLIDTLLHANTTRSMYLRRMRTIMDRYLAPGMIEAEVDRLYALIQPDAETDRTKWQMGPAHLEMATGVLQLKSQVLPLRRHQLFHLYGPNGSGLVPDAQPADTKIDIESVFREVDRDNQDQDYVQLMNNNEIAVDVSGWYIKGGGMSFRLLPGTVIPKNTACYIAADVRAFRAKKVSPGGGEGLFVTGNFLNRFAQRSGPMALRLFDHSNVPVASVFVKENESHPKRLPIPRD